MKRRDFFRLGVAGGAVAVLAPTLACTSSSSKAIDVSKTLSGFDVETSPYENLSIPEIQEQISSGNLSAYALTQHYIDRIKSIDWAGPTINSVIAINQKALDEAKALDAHYAESKDWVGPLHGIPVLLKDNINTRKSDGMRTTAGSLALMELWPEEDAPIVKKLRDAGAIILGKTNLSEWANFRSSSSSSGWSAVGGLTKNPHLLKRSACGSSSGSGASVAASLCHFAIGTETDGSIICPSAVNGIAGLKPTVGAISREGIVPISSSQDTAGPMAPRVIDLKIALDALGYDQTEANDPKSSDLPSEWKTTSNAKLKGARLGLCTNFLGRNTHIDTNFARVRKQLEEAGATIIELSINTRAYGGAEWEILQYEFKHDLNAFLQKYGNASIPQSLEELIAFNKEHAEKEMPFFQQEIFESCQEKGDLTEQTYLDALETAKKEAAGQLDALLEEHQLDAFIAPSNGPTWVIDLINGDSFSGGSSSPAAVSGYPNVTVPAGGHLGAPLGLSFFGAKWSEYKLLALAADYEALFPERLTPNFVENLYQGRRKEA
jgi:amidase